MTAKPKLELTRIGKENRSILEPYILLEEPRQVSQQISFKSTTDRNLKTNTVRNPATQIFKWLEHRYDFVWGSELGTS
ncbi:hypothetical protein V2H45_06815 [Tumidithrix elongata RA019]|uniref:Uncharacterized protein n=1 Tax=Tumidithrix elongata BACA0141 TaxID=2716417 RepID=A0AAW9Q1F5_9CYAN|nr:hypothetical protein [Tumidithrix elongata RA019]